MADKKSETGLESKQAAKSIENRRKAVRAIVLGGGAVTGAKSLPSEWSAPLVNSVVLPAHAETTDESGSSGEGATTTTAAPTTTVTPTTTTTTTTTTQRPTTEFCEPGYYYHPDIGVCYSYPPVT